MTPRRTLETGSLLVLTAVGVGAIALLLPLFHGILPPQASLPGFFASPAAVFLARIAERSPTTFRAATGVLLLLGAAATHAAARSRGARPFAAGVAAALLVFHPAVAQVLVSLRDASLLAAIPLGMLAISPPTGAGTARRMFPAAALVLAVLLHPAAISFLTPFLFALPGAAARRRHSQQGDPRPPGAAIDAVTLLALIAAVFGVCFLVTTHILAAGAGQLPDLAAAPDAILDAAARLLGAPGMPHAAAGLVVTAAIAGGILVPDNPGRILATWLAASLPAGLLCATEWGMIVTLLLPSVLLAARAVDALRRRPRLAALPVVLLIACAAVFVPRAHRAVREDAALTKGLLRGRLEIDRLSHEEPESAARFAFLVESPAFSRWIRESFGDDRAGRIPRLLQPRVGRYRFLPEKRHEFLEALHFQGTRIYEVDASGVVPATPGNQMPGVDWVSEFRFARGIRAADGPWAQWSCLLDPAYDPAFACVPSATAERLGPTSGEATITSLIRRPDGWWLDVEARRAALLVWSGSAPHLPGSLERRARPLARMTRLPPPPGTVRVDGRPVTTVPVDAVFAGILLEPGAHQVELHDPVPRSR